MYENLATSKKGYTCETISIRGTLKYDAGKCVLAVALISNALPCLVFVEKAKAGLPRATQATVASPSFLRFVLEIVYL